MPNKQPRYECPICETVFCHVVTMNPVCPQLSCNGAKLNPYTGPKKSGFTSFTVKMKKSKEKLDMQRAKLQMLRTRTMKKTASIGKQEEEWFENEADKAISLAEFALVEKQERDRSLQDYTFEANSTRWDFGQRLTVHDMTQRKPGAYPPLVLLKAAKGVVAGPIDGERKKQCCVTMGCHLGVKSISAYGASNQAGVPIGKPWSKGEKDTAEWCHLQGVSLGGKTVQENLVAASYCANTCMGVIEKFIQARTDLAVTVDVFGQKLLDPKLQLLCEHVAEKIVYGIHHALKQTQLVAIEIDARIQGFSDNDRDALEKLLKAKIPAMQS